MLDIQQIPLYSIGARDSPKQRQFASALCGMRRQRKVATDPGTQAAVDETR
jgi:hypothetical protein